MSANLNIIEMRYEVPGGELYAKAWRPLGSQARTTIVLFHDSIGCVEMWRGFPSALAAVLQLPVIAYDRLGYGRSSERRDLPSITFIADEAQFFARSVGPALQLQDCVLFGHSVGGAMAVVAASLLPQSCKAIVTEAAQPYVEPKTVQAIREAKIRFAAPEELAKLERFHGTKARWVVDAWVNTWLSTEFLEWNLRAALSQLRGPLLALHGDYDDYGSIGFPEALANWASFGGSKVILKGCGHVPHREHEQVVLETLQKFLTNALIGATPPCGHQSQSPPLTLS